MFKTKEQTTKSDEIVDNGLDFINKTLKKENLSAAEIEALAKLIDSLVKL